jgi:Ca2+:H+ antiporter
MSRRRSIVDIESADSDRLLLNNHNDVRSVQLSTNLIHDFNTILFSTYINVLLIFLPFAILSDAFNWSSTVVFAMNFLALIPLALLLSFTTKELTKRVGSTAGGLLNVTFGNATELIVGIVALRNDQINLIQTSMLGSILSTLLFVFTVFPSHLRIRYWEQPL